MKNVIFIGTLHAGLTPHNELAELLDFFRPELLLLEMVQNDMNHANIDTYPDEIVFAFYWGKENNIQTIGFDVPVNIFSGNKTDKDNEMLIEEQKAILKRYGYSWKDANTTKVNEMLNTPKAKTLVNSAQDMRREKEMVKNIKKHLDINKKIVVISGTKHLDIFEIEFPNSIFPFR